MYKNEFKRIQLSIFIAGVTILFLTILFISLNSKTDPVSITVLPEVPKEGLPIYIVFKLNNPSLKENMFSYELFSNGILLANGATLVSDASSKEFTYFYPGSPKLGEQITFLLKAESDQGSFEKSMSIPAYPPQVWSSFVSFASFSTSLMSSSMGSTMGSSMSSSMGSSMGTSISSMQFYNNSFINDNNLRIGLIFSILLIVLLVFLELTEPMEEKGFRIMGLRLRFGRLSGILFAIFIGMVFTKVWMVIG